MIQANELRIGNWVYAAYINNTSMKICSIEYTEGKDDDLYNPIPITSEILEKAGFDGDDSRNDYWLHDNENDIHLRIAFHIHDGVTEWNGIRLFEHIPHLHQLQNLYFALTGEELPIEL